MTHNQPQSGSAADAARSALVHRLTELLQGDATHVRVRVHGKQEFDRVWYYAKTNNRWTKQEGDVDDKSLAAAIEQELQLLASRGTTDTVSIRRHQTSDFIDTELQFTAAWLAERRGPRLESFISGVLFRDMHASGQDERRRIRTPHVGA